MGSCVISFVDRKHRKSVVPDPFITNYLNYGSDSVSVPSTGTSNSTEVYRNGRHHTDVEIEEFRHSAYYGPNNTQQFVTSCTSRSGNGALTYRPVKKVVKEEIVTPDGKKTLEVSYMGPRVNMTYSELWDFTSDVSRGLAELGLTARDNVAIYEETRWEWLSTAYALWLQDLVMVTVYANLGENGLIYALSETQCQAVVCNARSVPLLLSSITAGSIPPCTLIYFDELPANGCEVPEGIRLVSWKSVMELGSKAKSTRKLHVPEDNDKVALIMYTSGTTGSPKGVVHTHGSIAAGIKIMDNWLFSLIDFRSDDLYLAYLPLAHILEFGVVNIFLTRGATVAFSSPRTLTDLTTKPHGDLRELKPTLLIGVPRVFDALRRAVESKLPKPGTFRRRVFDHAYQSRLAALKDGKSTPYWDKKIFSKAKAAVGGSLRLLLCGGGPLSAATQEFVNVVFGLIVIGWGLTETVCVGAIQRLGDIDLCVTGQVLVGEELKLVDVEDYKHTDKPRPRGEICLRGPFLFKGYYKQPELTKEAIDEDGWFHTGDVGSIDSKGRVILIGRIKALAKNSLGEYIALEILESIYANHPLVVNNCVCVVVHPHRNYICALAVTDKGKVTRFIEEHNLSCDSDFPKVLNDPKFRQAAAASMASLAERAKRKPFEFVRRVCFVEEIWTPENGFLSASMKLLRRSIDAFYKKEIDELFSDN
ncbi:unnamed protein product [Phytomonas sp. EM1]|nr:unnamed protein product [Phytomonas sp. EM1]|eukprot:CCW64188.1 unnamed protein product [Phytomonas sp. isolate EM1]